MRRFSITELCRAAQLYPRGFLLVFTCGSVFAMLAMLLKLKL